MAAMSTSLSEFSDRENARTFILNTHTVLSPQLVIQKRKVPTTSTGVQESQLTVVYGTTDAEGSPLQSKVAFSASVRYPVNGDSTDVTAALAVFRDLVASDEFTAMVNTQAYIK